MTPRPCFNQLKLAVVQRREPDSCIFSKVQRATPQSSSKSDPDSAPGTDPGAGAGLADAQDVMISPPVKQ